VYVYVSVDGWMGGCQRGSILPYLDVARRAGYSFIVLNPNANYSDDGRVR
jgi:hypothetical protein